MLIELTLLDSFELRCDGHAVPLPTGAQRLLAFLALQDHPVLRVYVAGKLWLDSPEERSFANLRSTLWRLNQASHVVVDTSNHQLGLARDVQVDYRDAVALAHRLLSGSSEHNDLEMDWSLLAGQLLPDWYDEWVLFEQERYRQLGLHALESLSERLAAARRFGPALETALAAVSVEPLRESAHRVLIKTHLAEGNTCEALREYRLYRDLLNKTLAIDPSPAMTALVEGLTIR